jgi:uncharacterized protein
VEPVGSAYGPGLLRQALEVDRTPFEYNALIRPTSDVELYLTGAAEQPTWERAREWVRKKMASGATSCNCSASGDR